MMINMDLNFGILAGHNLWQSLVIVAVVFGILKKVKDTSAEERSWSWSATLFALALLPLAAFLPGEGVNWQSDQVFNQSGTAKIERNFVPTKAFIKTSSGQLEKNKSKLKFKSTPDNITVNATNNDKLIMGSILGVWVLGMLIAFCRLSIAAYNAGNLRKFAYPFAQVADEFGSHWPDHVEIAVSDEINGPLVVGFFRPIILVPHAFIKEMSMDELLPLLYHELAHIKRHDNILHLLERVILAIYWWNPVMHFIARHISEERELACDDRAAKSCGDQIKYAKSLLKGARQLISYNRPVLGLAVLRRESPLSMRVKRLTSANSVFNSLSLIRLTKNLTIVFLSIILLGLITPRVARGQIDINRDGHSSVETFIGDKFLEVEWQGKIELNEEETNITGMDNDGYFSLETRQNGESRKLVLTGKDKNIDRHYYKDGKSVDIDETEYAWQAENLKAMLRLSGINAEKRVDWIYSRGGANAVLDEIDLLLSDYAVRLYTESLVDVYDLDQTQIARLIKKVDSMNSDYEKGLALSAIGSEQKLDKNTELLLNKASENIPDLNFASQNHFIDLPTKEEIKKIVEDAKKDALSKEELERIIADAKKDVPTEEEIEKIIKESLANLPTEEELAEIVKEAKENMPDAIELKRIVEEARANVPDQEELKRIIEQAKANVPTKEELEKIIKQAMANMPSDQELEQMQLQLNKELNENLENIPSVEERTNMRERIQRDIENVRRDRERLNQNKQN
ncbi:MAG: hypothetical protein H6912_02205 [Kordiimonadaceae bacterium]|nr:hypothetical protein [Kordiimonadaceae bacterium]